jgi:magnesium transporter
MEKNIISVKTLDDQEYVASSLSKYDFLALPVVDTENRLVGIVTVDDAIDVLQDEATEDIEKMAAIVPTDKPYLKTSDFRDIQGQNSLAAAADDLRHLYRADHLKI